MTWFLRSYFQKSLLVLLMSVSLWLTLISFAKAEVIHSFNSNIVVNEDSSFIVTETIVYDFEGQNKHGIFRNIKAKHPQGASDWYKDRYLDINLISVTRDGSAEPYLLESYDGLSVRIGDANHTITGPHTYQIVYQVEGGLAKYQDGTEVYWNVTGDEWEVEMEEVTVTVSTTWSEGLAAEGSCYVGTTGSTERCQSIDSNDKATYRFNNLNFGEQVTIAKRLNFPNEILVLEEVRYSQVLFIVSLLWLIGFSVWSYRWHFAYRTPQSIIAQYEPLLDFKPMFTGVLFDGRLDQKDITAAIIYLAQQGYLIIKQTEQKILFFKVKDHEITLQKPIPSDTDSFDDEIAGLLFLAPEMGNEVVKISEIAKNRSKLLQNQIVIRGLNKSVEKTLVEGGFIEQRYTRRVRVIIAILFPSVLIFMFSTIDDISLYLNNQITNALPVVIFGFVMVVTGLIWLIFGSERRTSKGYEALNYLKGFKEFLSVTEKERYKFHNAPALSPDQFMEYLPYAIAFGVEKEWAEIFKDIQITPPDWYQGGSFGSSFNAPAFAAGLGSFSNSLGTSAGTSGSSGGGSSGGGGGGGGGGSW